MSIIRTVEELEALYGQPGEASLVKELDRLIPEYAALIEAAIKGGANGIVFGNDGLFKQPWRHRPVDDFP